jgi:predicted amidophosphoribosyltransferase
MSTTLGVCRTCAHNVDEHAKRCPNCGRKWPVLSNGQRSLHTWMIVAGVILLVLVLLPRLTG